jgi:curved DNA-binding protein
MGTNPPPDHYHALGLQRSATADQVRRAYRRLARRHHPDVSPDPDATRRFAEIQNAYAVLSDRRRRAEYDRLLDQARTDAAPPGTPHYSWRNVATEASPGADQPRPRTELDEMYDAFFGGPADR